MENKVERKIKGYVIEHPCMNVYAGETIMDVKHALEQIIVLDELEVGEELKIKVVEHTLEELDKIPEL